MILKFPSSGDLVPEFSDGFPVNITVQRENTAFLDCPVKNPGDRPVSYPLVRYSATSQPDPESEHIPISDLLGENTRLAHPDQWPGEVHH